VDKRKLFLVCNAHLDPVWAWELEEGIATTLATFRTAAELCEEFDGFVFNHNEVILYDWIERYDPELFSRIQKLVKEKKWHIMGGWYLQPDCNMPSGESFVRQILVGRNYFQKKFGARPTTAINFDPFGHSQGLVQILAKSGYDSYLFCRPHAEFCTLPGKNFNWIGFDNSSVVASRMDGFYGSPLGQARNKATQWMKDNPEEDQGIVLWGVGNHGGGPSREDLHSFKDFIKQTKDMHVSHATPEDYFTEVKKDKDKLPNFNSDINPWGVGCYTSMIRIKQKYRLLENELFAVEKMVSIAALQNLIDYPQEELQQAQKDLLTCAFHDILPGSGIQPVEEAAIRMFDHGLEILSRIKTQTFFALANGQKRAKNGDTPILVYNPHPVKVSGYIECEFHLENHNPDQKYVMPRVYSNQKEIESQVEKEFANLNAEWRKKVVFYAELQPSQMNRFDCKFSFLDNKPEPELIEENDEINFQTEKLDIKINTKTGFVDKYRINNKDFLKPNAFRPIVIQDNEDSWGSEVKSFPQIVGHFSLMSEEQASVFSGVKNNKFNPVRVVENGPMRVIVEVLLTYGNSFICQHYKLPKLGTEIEIESRVYWNEKDKMLKLSIPTDLRGPEYRGQVAYGISELPNNGDEAVSQKWSAVVSNQQKLALTCINNGTYGSSLLDGELGLSLLRSCAYTCMPIYDRPLLVQDRFSPRIDQGERLYRFWINGGTTEERLSNIDGEALIKNEKPMALAIYPSGSGALPQPGIVLSDEAIQLCAFKKAENDDNFILRLFEPTGNARTTTLEIKSFLPAETISFTPFEIKTFKFDLKSRTIIEVDLTENCPE
jgi:alpha-mannosidase